MPLGVCQTPLLKSLSTTLPLPVHFLVFRVLSISMETRGGIVDSEKDLTDCDVGLGLGTQCNESLPRKKIVKTMTTTQFHRMNLLPSSDSSGSTFGFNSSGGMTFPFTAAQWTELERQTVIYKCMMASIPVPPELLIPINRNLSNVVTPSRSGGMELGFSTNSHPEPWRCRRTDGKKWRCSRDVAPDQKYCERHSHKGRPRSRKPVELQSDTTKNSPRPHFLQRVEEPLCSLPSSMAASYEQPPPRGLEWFIKGEANPVSCANQEWQQRVQSNLKSTQVPLKFYSDYGAGLFPNQTKETRHFIDAWSPAITLSMGGGNESDEKDEDPQMGTETFGFERENVGDSRPHWMSPADTWMSSPPGGPLAEALCLGISSSSKADHGTGSSSSRNS